MPFAANIGVAVEQDVIATAIMFAILCLHASDVHQHVQSKPSSDIALLRHWLSKLVYKPEHI